MTSPFCLPISPLLSPLLLTADNGNQRLAICVDLAGYVYVPCGGEHGAHVVEVREPRKNFSLLQTLGSGSPGHGAGQFKSPTGLCVDQTNTLMVVDNANHRVQFFD